MAIQTIRVAPKVELAFGLSWEQLDPFSESEHGAIKRWRDQGFARSARYRHDGGRVYGLVGQDAPAALSGTLAGAAVLATHPALRGKTGLVLLEVNIADSASVICVGLRAGVVVVDRIVATEEVATVRHAFLKDFAPDHQFSTWGDVHSIADVDHELPLANLVPGKGQGKPIRIGGLRSSRWPVLVASGVAVAALMGLGWQAWTYAVEQDEMLAKMRLQASQTPQVLYAAEIERWLKRPIMPAADAVAAVRDGLRTFPLFHAGWVVSKASCQAGGQCSIQWTRKDGTLQEFKATAPSTWHGITPMDQDSLSMSIELESLKLENSKGLLKRAGWPTAADYRAQQISHWQFLAPGGWKASLGAPIQRAIPASFTPEQVKAVQNMPGAPWGMEVGVRDQAWWYADVDPNSPTAPEHLGRSIELTSPIELTFVGNDITFSFTGVAYVEP